MIKMLFIVISLFWLHYHHNQFIFNHISVQIAWSSTAAGKVEDLQWEGTN